MKNIIYYEDIVKDKNAEIGYCCRYDTLFNKKSNIWLEEGCDNPECIFCSDIPEKHPVDCECVEYSPEKKDRMYLVNGLIENHS